MKRIVKRMIKRKSEIALALLAAFLILIAFIAFAGIFYADTSQASPSQLWEASGMGRKPSGDLVTGSCFTLTFAIPAAHVIINNQTGADAYYILNDTGCAAGSSYYDHVLDDGEDAFWDGWLKVEWMTVYISPTSGFTVTGW